MAIATLYGNLTPTEKFIFKYDGRCGNGSYGWNEMIQEVYAANSREHLEGTCWSGN